MSTLFLLNISMTENIHPHMFQWTNVRAFLTTWEDLVLLLVIMVSYHLNKFYSIYATNRYVCFKFTFAYL